MIAYTVIVPGTFFLAFWEFNEKYPIRGSVFLLYGVYVFLLASTTAIELIFGRDISSFIRGMLTPVVVILAVTMGISIVRQLRRGGVL
ncbi:MAG: hypothetical protein D6800_08700 [Candidatus Zixiibacteriota bacterium]|nr:MAG: hypothetical protein D6800_08700 [candidate division Zixibacteria bacterium]